MELSYKISKIKANKFVRFLFYPGIMIKRYYYKQKNKKKYFYQCLFSNVKEGSLVVSINNIPGSFEIDARSHILQRILLNKKYEPKTAISIKKNIKRNKDTVNIGANTGIFSIYMAQQISDKQKVLAIEPTPLAFQYLKNNILRNSVNDKVILFNGICVDRIGTYNINTIIGKEEYSSLGYSAHMDQINESIIQIQVQGETVDNLIKKHALNPGLIVIDVEGSEMKVLYGAKETISNFRPIIITELNDQMLINQDTSSLKVIDFLNNLGYQIENIDNKSLRYPFSGNIIAIPK